MDRKNTWDIPTIAYFRRGVSESEGKVIVGYKNTDNANENTLLLSNERSQKRKYCGFHEDSTEFEFSSESEGYCSRSYHTASGDFLSSFSMSTFAFVESMRSRVKKLQYQPAIANQQQFLVDSLKQETIYFSNSLHPSELDNTDNVERTSSVLLAIWNLLPLLQGSSTFSMPYAVVCGGYISILLIPFISIISDLTGNILVDCLYDDSPIIKYRKRQRKTYADIAYDVWGSFGVNFVNTLLMFYLVTGAVVNVVLLGKSAYALVNIFENMSFALITALLSLLCYPTLFITQMTTLAYLSFLSVLSVTVGILAVMFVFVKEANLWATNFGEIPFVNIQGLPLSASIIMFSCLTHSVLPQVEGSMKEPEKCGRAIHISYFLSAIVKMLVAFFGAVTYANSTNSIISLNAGNTDVIAKYVCSISIIGFAIFNYPLNLFVVSEAIDAAFDSSKYFQNKICSYITFSMSRLVLLIISIIIALVVPYFGLLLAVRGSMIGTCLIFIFPCFFHLKLKWHDMNIWGRLVDITLLIIGSTIGAFGLYISLLRLFNQIWKDYSNT